ncbi:MAG: TrmB family transcriptional regulator [Halobacteriaceae archaeon]
MKMDQPRTAAGVAIPEGLESSSAKLVYLYLEITQGATLGDLRDALDLTRLTLCSILRTLRDRGFVRKSGDHFTPA